jgi:hypothetical protein
MRPLRQSADFFMRPSIRVLSALLMLVLAYAFVDYAIPVFQADELRTRSCGHGKGKEICQLFNILWSFVPPSAHGELEGTGALLAAAFLVYFAWLLLKSLLQNARKPDESDA